MRRGVALRRIRELCGPQQPQPTAVTPLLEPLAGVRAVLLDVYGTLFVSAPAGARGPDGPLAEAFAALGLPLPAALVETAEGLLEAIIGEHQDRARAGGAEPPEIDIVAVFRELLRRLASAAALPLPRDRGTAERLALEQELRRNRVWPMPGAAAALAGLRDRGLPLGIVSNSQFYTPWLFPALLGGSLSTLGFRRALCSWSYRFLCAKPSPRLFQRPLRWLRRRGIPPEAVLMVGNDFGRDLLPASHLGCRTALFAGDARSYKPASGPDAAGRPDALLTALAQLPGIVR